MTGNQHAQYQDYLEVKLNLYLCFFPTETNIMTHFVQKTYSCINFNLPQRHIFVCLTHECELWHVDEISTNKRVQKAASIRHIQAHIFICRLSSHFHLPVSRWRRIPGIEAGTITGLSGERLQSRSWVWIHFRRFIEPGSKRGGDNLLSRLNCNRAQCVRWIFTPTVLLTVTQSLFTSVDA